MLGAVVAAGVLFDRPGLPPISKPPKTPGKPSPKPPKEGDLISYYIDAGTGMIVVKTGESPDVAWGSPLLKPEKFPLFQEMTNHWQTLVDDASLEYRVPSKDIFAIMWSESNGNPNVTSKAGAKGLMQVMPFHFPTGTTEAQMLDPRNNIRTGARILASRRAGGSRDLIQVASLYNAGGNADGTPFTNEQRPKIATRWGYAAEPGYIDSVVAAYNTAVKLGIVA